MNPVFPSQLLFTGIAALSISSCQPYQDDYERNRPAPIAPLAPVITTPQVRPGGGELFASDPLIEFQRTNTNPAPIRNLSAGEDLTIISSDGRFSRVRLSDGTTGYISNSNINRGSGGDNYSPPTSTGSDRIDVGSPMTNDPGGIDPVRPLPDPEPEPVNPLDRDPADTETIDLDGI